MHGVKWQNTIFFCHFQLTLRWTVQCPGLTHSDSASLRWSIGKVVSHPYSRSTYSSPQQLSLQKRLPDSVEGTGEVIKDDSPTQDGASPDANLAALYYSSIICTTTGARMHLLSPLGGATKYRGSFGLNPFDFCQSWVYILRHSHKLLGHWIDVRGDINHIQRYFVFLVTGEHSYNISAPAVANPALWEPSVSPGTCSLGVDSSTCRC